MSIFIGYKETRVPSSTSIKDLLTLQSIDNGITDTYGEKVSDYNSFLLSNCNINEVEIIEN